MALGIRSRGAKINCSKGTSDGADSAGPCLSEGSLEGDGKRVGMMPWAVAQADDSMVFRTR